MLCSARTICAATTVVSTQWMGFFARMAPAPFDCNFELGSVAAKEGPGRMAKVPVGTPGQLCMPLNFGNAKAVHKARLCTFHATAAPSSAGWKMTATVPSKARVRPGIGRHPETLRCARHGRTRAFLPGSAGRK